MISRVIEEKFKILFDNDIINYSEMGFLVFLIVKFTDNISPTLKNSDGSVCTQKDIMLVSGLTKPTISRFFKALINKNLISEKKHCSIKNAKEYSISVDEIEKIVRAVKSKPKKFKECDLENLLVNNIGLIEQGMKVISQQYPVKGGYIDILARDKNDQLCIVELKNTSNDIKIIQQSVYYPTQFDEKVRMITIAPDYSNKVRTSLESLGYVEMKTFDHNSGRVIINDLLPLS